MTRKLIARLYPPEIVSVVSSLLVDVAALTSFLQSGLFLMLLKTAFCVTSFSRALWPE
jgi:hypothetical protein